MTELKKYLQDLHYQYLLSCGDVGGTADGFREYVLDGDRRLRVKQLLRECEDDAIGNSANSTWNALRKPRQAVTQMSLCLDGRACPEWFTYRIDGDGYGRILAHHAKVRHLQSQWETMDTKAHEAQSAADDFKRDLLEPAIARANGDMDVRLLDLVDKGSIEVVAD